MAEALLSVLLVTSSSKGSSLLYRWPPHPESSSRLARPRPQRDALQYDNPYRAAFYPDIPSLVSENTRADSLDDPGEYEWKRPTTARDRSMSFTRSAPAQQSGRKSPSKGDAYDQDEIEEQPATDEYHDLFGYSSEFLAGMLCPQKNLCHQKFELVVDDLAFIGHPVCVDTDGKWLFRTEAHGNGTRGRGSRHCETSQKVDEQTESEAALQEPVESLWLQMFHFVIVLNLPDPSSSASGNVAKYFDIIYEQIAFVVTAVLFQEQVHSNFVESECDTLGSLKDECMAKGAPFEDYMSSALRVSSIASAMKAVYEAIKSSSVGYITIHNLPLELQLPPYLDYLLHGEGDDSDYIDYRDEGEEIISWGRDMSIGWRLPTLAPWKSLLLLDNEQGLDPFNDIRNAQVHPEERDTAEGLIKFLETASVTLSLADMASLLDWDLDSQIYPTVRWLVQHRRAKIVDTVHRGLRTIFTLPAKFEAPLSQLNFDFERDFAHASIPSLPSLLATISTASSKQTDNHFFAAVVRSKDLIPLYHTVLLWLLKRDLIITLHLRIRVIATSDLKVRVRIAHEQKMERLASCSHGRRASQRASQGEGTMRRMSGQTGAASGIAWLSLSPKSAHRYTRRLSSTESTSSRLSHISGSALIEEDEDVFEDDDEESEEENVGWGSREDSLWPSMISDPGTASPLERKWLTAMSDGKDETIAKLFNRINQYFDGKKTDDEILFRAEISRKQLREVLHLYDEYLQTFLHPS